MKNRLVTIFVALALCGAPALAAVHSFPSDDSTVVGSVGFIDADEIGAFWSVARGDMVEETSADPLISVEQASMSLLHS